MYPSQRKKSQKKSWGGGKKKLAYGAIHWRLKCRRGRLAAITAVASRYDSLRYVGGKAQLQAVTHHGRAQDRDGWRYDNAEVELELIQTHMPQKPALRVDDAFREHARKSFIRWREARFGV